MLVGFSFRRCVSSRPLRPVSITRVGRFTPPSLKAPGPACSIPRRPRRSHDDEQRQYRRSIVSDTGTPGAAIVTSARPGRRWSRVYHRPRCREVRKIGRRHGAWIPYDPTTACVHCGRTVGARLEPWPDHGVQAPVSARHDRDLAVGTGCGQRWIPRPARLRLLAADSQD